MSSSAAANIVHYFIEISAEELSMQPTTDDVCVLSQVTIQISSR